MPTSRGPRFGFYEEKNFCLFFVSVVLGVFISFFCLGVQRLFVYVFVFANGHSRQPKSLLLLDLYH